MRGQWPWFILCFIGLGAAIILGFQCTASCSKKKPSHPRSGAVALLASEPVEYPIDWPLDRLRAPPGSVKAFLPPMYTYWEEGKEAASVKGETSGGSLFWMAGFYTADSWIQVVNHVEGTLLPLGYIKYDWLVCEPSLLSRNRTIFNDYCAPDGLAQVRIGYHDCPGNAVEDPYECFYLRVDISDKPMQPLASRKAKHGF